MKRMLAGELRRFHFEIDVERVVPELSSPESDAIMDDVTVRTPHATRCSQASARPGEAASLGASDKREREAQLSGVEAVHAWVCMCGCSCVDFILLDSGCQESQKERE